MGLIVYDPRVCPSMVVMMFRLTAQNNPQGQVYIQLSLRAWILEWTLRGLRWIVRVPQRLHAYGCSPVWIMKCRLSVYLVSQTLPHAVQM